MCLGAIILASRSLLPAMLTDQLFEGVLFTKKSVLLGILKGEVPLANPAIATAATLTCMLMESENLGLCNVWPQDNKKEHLDYYCELALCLYTLILDPAEEFLRYLAIRVFDAFLMVTGPLSIGYEMITSVWNSILLERLQAGVFVTNKINLSVHYIDFATALVKSNCPAILLFIDRQALLKLLAVFIHDSCEYNGEIMRSLSRFAYEMSRAGNLGLLTNTDCACIQAKIRLQSMKYSAPSALTLLKAYLETEHTL
ncbi:unnamed protein product [Dicrocoelium dendriticum]|nr:unnamed protein product [Dicrocoelium dendriticum]